MSHWDIQPCPFRFRLSDWTFLTVTRLLQCRSIDILTPKLPDEAMKPPTDGLLSDSQGFLIRAMPLEGELPAITPMGDFLRYVPLQYLHSHIDLTMSFEDYQQKFSSKTRATLNRKVRKFAQHCGGELHWKAYVSRDDMDEFFRHARAVSARTYQERLLDAGIPGSDSFIANARTLADEDRLRAYILFDGDRPVSYLYCPVHASVLIYAYLGYDPDYARLSVGTVLQWLALESLFAEGKFRAFDFTEGQSDHKRLFATHQQQRGNVYFLRHTIGNRLLVSAHHRTDLLSAWFGNQFDRFGLKARIKRLIRSTN
ncbi:MAG: GNAT family N-acetyltransferase [Gammaproteobacteria bacterium]|nr:GNAT family N-acetyltransferase [Gammaproteobacteria bacterium]MCP5137085.1 GNAT family N-acetyltransferase [Gammaproteobacteria bacterium]